MTTGGFCAVYPAGKEFFMAIASFEHFADKYFSGDKDTALKALSFDVYSCELKLAGTREEVFDIMDTMEEDEKALYDKYLAELKEKYPSWQKPHKKISLRLRLLNKEYGDFAPRGENGIKNPYILKTAVFAAVFALGLIGVFLYRNKPDLFVSEEYPKLYDKMDVLFKLIADVGLIGGLLNAWRIYLFDSAKKLILGGRLVAVEATEEGTLDEGALDESALDEGALDEGALDEDALDEGAVQAEE